jgi:hypothetical protein
LGQSQGKQLNLRRTILPLVATGGLAAALFGGNAVHTAFTSTATGTINASTASIGTKITDGTVTLTNAIPGDIGPTSNVTITNQGSTPETLSVLFGAGSNVNLDQVVDVYWNGVDVGSISSIDNTNLSLGTNILSAKGGANASATIPVWLELEAGATDTVANGSDVVSFTITGTATDAQQNGGTIGTPVPGGWNIVKNQES